MTTIGQLDLTDATKHATSVATYERVRTAIYARLNSDCMNAVHGSVYRPSLAAADKASRQGNHADLIYARMRVIRAKFNF